MLYSIKEKKVIKILKKTKKTKKTIPKKGKIIILHELY